jgi:hypothetical protein
VVKKTEGRSVSRSILLQNKSFHTLTIYSTKPGSHAENLEGPLLIDGFVSEMEIELRSVHVRDLPRRGECSSFD